MRDVMQVNATAVVKVTLPTSVHHPEYGTPYMLLTYEQAEKLRADLDAALKPRARTMRQAALQANEEAEYVHKNRIE
jgi:hypothetical protein